MLDLIGVSLKLPRKGADPLVILDEVTFTAPSSHVLGIVGPTLSGKTTLLEILAGTLSPTIGSVLWNGRETRKHPLHPNQIGFVPSGDEDILPQLTVRENIISALMLRVEGITPDAAQDKAAKLLILTGLETVARKRFKLLSLAQKRRTKMAVALVSDPAVVLCDSFTDRLDARSGRELAALLKEVAADHPARLVIQATDDLSDIDCHDSVLLLHDGFSCYHGPVRAIVHYFSIKTPMELFARLAQRPGSRWGESWARHRDSYYKAFKLGTAPDKLAAASENDESADPDRVRLPQESQEEPPVDETSSADGSSKAELGAVTSSTMAAVPSLALQTRHLIKRRWTELRRTRHEWIVLLSLLLGSPLLVILLIAPNVESLRAAASAVDETVLSPDELWPAAFTCLTGVFVQTLLVLFASVRLGAREIAADRRVFERERVGGLSSAAYVLSKLALVLPLSFIQAFSMGILVEMSIGGFPGHGIARLTLLILSGVAFALLCLGISSNSQTKERAYGFAMTLLFGNVMVSGAILGLPRVLGSVIQPFSTAYYGWSGSIDSMHSTPVFGPMTQLVPTWFASPAFAVIMLIIHAAFGLALLLAGLRKRRRI